MTSATDNRTPELREMNKLLIELESLEAVFESPASYMTLGEYEQEREKLLDGFIQTIDSWNTGPERTCHVEAFDDGMDEALDGGITSYSPPTWYLSCSHTSEGMERPGYCPNCGARVER